MLHVVRTLMALYGTCACAVLDAWGVFCIWLGLDVTEIGRRKRNQPAPLHVVFGVFTDPDRDFIWFWLDLFDDEVRPRVLQADPFLLVVWSSFWLNRFDVRIRFDLLFDVYGQGTDLCWTLLVDDSPPDEAFIGYMCKRVNQLINANLWYMFGQQVKRLEPVAVRVW